MNALSLAFAAVFGTVTIARTVVKSQKNSENNRKLREKLVEQFQTFQESLSFQKHTHSLISGVGLGAIRRMTNTVSDVKKEFRLIETTLNESSISPWCSCNSM